MAKHLLPLIPPDLVVEEVHLEAERIVVVARPRSSKASCPLCGRPSWRRHSHHERLLVDLPCHGRRAVVLVRARRWRCATAGCARRVFAERLPEVVRPHGRRTERMGELQRHLGLALGGQAGARLAGCLGAPVSGDTLLRLVRRGAPVGAAPVATRVLGVDDWAWRRGRRYGTILCDLERGQVVDLLPDRCADTLAAWLRERPGVAVVVRDRAGAYADGARRGAPDAVQVADRWHLLRNASDALLYVLERHRGALARVAREVVGQATAAVSPEPPAPRPPTKLQKLRRRRQAERDACFEEVASRARAGMAAEAISRETGIASDTVRNWLRAGAAPTGAARAGGAPASSTRPSPLPRRALAGGRRQRDEALARDPRHGLQGAGRRARGSASPPSRRGASSSGHRASEAPVRQRPTPRRTAHLVLCGKTITGLDGRFLEGLVQAAPEIGCAVAEARAFAALIRDRDRAAFNPWLERCRDGPLSSLAASLERDRAAAEAALELPWSTSPVERHTHRLKLIKRTMYGRAGLDLLRARMLAA